MKEWCYFLPAAKAAGTETKLSLDILMLSARSVQVLFTTMLQLEGIHLFQIRHQKMRCLNPNQSPGISISMERCEPFQWSKHVAQRQAFDRDLMNNTYPANPSLQVPTSPH